MFAHESYWEAVASSLLGAPGVAEVPTPEALRPLVQAAYRVAARGIGQGGTLWCAWREDTLQFGLFYPIERLFHGGMPVALHRSQAHHKLDLPGKQTYFQFEGELFALACSLSALHSCALDERLRQWAKALPLRADAISEHTLVEYGLIGIRHVGVFCSLKRRAGLLKRDVPVEAFVKQVGEELERLKASQLFDVERPVALPRTIDELIEMLDKRFFNPALYPEPSTPESRSRYNLACSLLQGMWEHKEWTRPSTTDRTSCVAPSYVAFKHLLIRRLLEPFWNPLRRELLDRSLAIKNTWIGNEHKRRKDLPDHQTVQTLALVYATREDPALREWFQKEYLQVTLLADLTFEDIPPAKRQRYASYALADELRRAGVSVELRLDAHGEIAAAQRWVERKDGTSRLTLDVEAFFPALQNMFTRHLRRWAKGDLPRWICSMIELRFNHGDLRFADVIAWHPDYVRILNDRALASPQAASWLLSWLRHHHDVQRSAFFPALLGLTPEQIVKLSDYELYLLYEQLERAPSELRRAHPRQTRTIVACAVSRFSQGRSFDKLDEILSDGVDAELMAHLNATIDSLSLLDAKRRALKRERDEALATLQAQGFEGRLSVHDAQGTRKGALSRLDDEPDS